MYLPIRSDGQNYDSQDRASIAARSVKTVCVYACTDTLLFWEHCKNSHRSHCLPEGAEIGVVVEISKPSPDQVVFRKYSTHSMLLNVRSVGSTTANFQSVACTKHRGS